MLNVIREHLMNGKRVLVIMRGVPGSGKSTAANSIKCLDGRVFICSTDNVNTALNGGEYIFEPKNLGLFHKINRETALACMKNRADVVVIDNTNIKRKDYRDYVADGQLYGYEIVEWKIGETDFTGANHPLADKYAARNTHGVPYDVILRMGRQFQE